MENDTHSNITGSFSFALITLINSTLEMTPSTLGSQLEFDHVFLSPENVKS